jgi:selenocysteine-specific elongation factor
MASELILGTAGHIDHGKTALVKALTGVDCDRLPEEKARGITIDIGFAPLQLGEFHLGIVDVPGHERFIKNMLAGATGVDLAMLVVAVDDGVMPQTREHLEILNLLGLRHGFIALTKCDLMDATAREVAELEVRELVEGTFLENAPLVATSAHTGAGIPELEAAIAEVCRSATEAADSSAADRSATWFRMAIDRAFVVQGHGTVVTGSVVSGSVRVGNEVEWLPSGDRVRVRSLQNHERPVEEAHRGMRAAINLAGVPHDSVIRGQELATPGYLVPSRVLTVRLLCLAGAKRPIKHRASVRFHIGTLEIMGTLSLLDADAVAPGDWAFAQVFLEEPATATWGQAFVIRGPSATYTLGGGQVLQPVARKIRRRHLEMLEAIEQLHKGDAAARALAVARFAGFAGVTPADLVRNAGVMPGRCEDLLRQLRGRGDLVEIGAGPTRHLLLHKDLLDDLDSRILAAMARLHAESPLVTLHDRHKVQAEFDYVGDDALVQAAIERLLSQKKLVGDLRRIARADFKPKLSANLRKLKDKVVAAYQAAGFQPPEPADFANQAGGNVANLKDLFEVCLAEDFLVPIAEGIYLHAEAEAEMRKHVTERLATGTGATVAEIRSLLGTTRKFAVPFCEYLDRVGVTRREGDLRVAAKVEPVK